VIAKEVLRTFCTTAYAKREPFLYVNIIQEEQQHRQEYIDNEIDRKKAIRTEVSRGREGRRESLEGRVVLEKGKIVVFWTVEETKRKKSSVPTRTSCHIK